MDTVIYFRVHPDMARKLDELMKETYAATRGEYLRSILREQIRQSETINQESSTVGYVENCK
jgi:metal-responsive CopG/Arc/MetJ family transcriptional regulator